MVLLFFFFSCPPHVFERPAHPRTGCVGTQSVRLCGGGFYCLLAVRLNGIDSSCRYRFVFSVLGIIRSSFSDVFADFLQGSARRADGEGLAGGGLRDGRRAVLREERETHRRGAAANREMSR